MQHSGNFLLDNSASQKAQTKPMSSFLQYIHYFRAIAIIGIVAVHCKSSFGWKNNFEEQFWSSILVYSTILFVFIAGFLFQHIQGRKFDYKNYLNKKISYVILPYLFASIPAILEKLYLDRSGMEWLPDYLKNSADVFKVIYMLMTGKHFGPFWFIPMISLVYLVSPLLIYLDKKWWFHKIIFPIIFVAGLFTFNFGFEFSAIESFVFFIPIYMFGMWSSRNKEYLIALQWKLMIPLSLLFIGFVALELAGVIALDTSYGAYRPEETYYFPFNFGKLKMSMLCLILLNGLYLIRHKNYPLLSFLADYSFGIYFVHLYIIRIIEMGIHKLNMSFQFNSFYFIMHVFFITILCSVTIVLIKKIFGTKSRYVIGS